jgi:hypothetical protein
MSNQTVTLALFAIFGLAYSATVLIAFRMGRKEVDHGLPDQIRRLTEQLRAARVRLQNEIEKVRLSR